MPGEKKGHYKEEVEDALWVKVGPQAYWWDLRWALTPS